MSRPDVDPELWEVPPDGVPRRRPLPLSLNARRAAEKRDTIAFMKALVRFAYGPLSASADPDRVIYDAFKSVRIVPDYTNRADQYGFQPTWPQAGRRIVTTIEPWKRLCAQLRKDLKAIANVISKEDADRAFFDYHLKRQGDPTTLAGWHRSKLPKEIQRRIEKKIPPLMWMFGTALVPNLFDSNLDELLYYGLGLAVSRGVLDHCGKCAYCRRLVIHEKPAPKPPARSFCTDRDCRTRFHNKQKTSANKRKAQARWRQKDKQRQERAKEHDHWLLAFGEFLRFAADPNNELAIGSVVRKLGVGNIRAGWKTVDQLKEMRRNLEVLAGAWQSISPVAKQAIVEWYNESNSMQRKPTSVPIGKLR